MTLANVMFRAMYRFGFKPWDSGVPPPELEALIEGTDGRPPGKALDLGCGTGTNAVYMAQHGWDVTAIDFVPSALAAARRRAEAARVSPRFVRGDVTRLESLDVGRGYTLAFDLGCLHSIPDDRRDAYAAGLTEATVPGADYLVWGFYAERPTPLMRTHLTRDELQRRFGTAWDTARAWEGERPGRFAGAWYHLKRR
jgi:SAM-dependent methyltransferase